MSEPRVPRPSPPPDRPCPVCFAVLRLLPEGWVCDRHGLQAKR